MASSDSVIFKVLPIVTALFTCAVAGYIALDSHDKGSVPEKRVELTQETNMNVSYLTFMMGDKATISLKIGGQTLTNVFVIQTSFHNIGKAPITPADYYDHLAVSVDPAWRIVDVENAPGVLGGVPLVWSKLSETKYEAAPALFNPGDYERALVYVAPALGVTTNPLDLTKVPTLQWTARIANLQGFTHGEDFLQKAAKRRFLADVDLTGWSLLFVIGAAFLFVITYLRLLKGAGILRSWNWPSILITSAVSLFSFAVAETMATYLFGTIYTDIVGVDFWMNGPFIVVHFALLIGLTWAAWRRTALGKS